MVPLKLDFWVCWDARAHCRPFAHRYDPHQRKGNPSFPVQAATQEGATSGPEVAPQQRCLMPIDEGCVELVNIDGCQWIEHLILG